VSWQAVLISPSRIGRLAFFALILVFWMRCTQNVHFSITPRERTVTSGLNTIDFNFIFGSSVGVNGVTPMTSTLLLKKLKRRTLYGQLFEQYRVPMQRL